MNGKHCYRRKVMTNEGLSDPCFRTGEVPINSQPPLQTNESVSRSRGQGTGIKDAPGKTLIWTATLFSLVTSPQVIAILLDVTSQKCDSCLQAKSCLKTKLEMGLICSVELLHVFSAISYGKSTMLALQQRCLSKQTAFKICISGFHFFLFNPSIRL